MAFTTPLMQIRSFFRKLDRLRRSSSVGLMPLMLWLLGRDPHLVDARISPSEIKTILVLRNNKRIGNMYFLLPFLHELRHACPAATIDLMVIHKSQRNIFQNMGINEISISSFSFRGVGEFFRSIKSARKNVYDLIVMPYSSDTDILIGAMLHAKNKVAFKDRRTHGIYPHALSLKPESLHAALYPLELIRAMSHSVRHPADHKMRLSLQEVNAGEIIAGQLKGGSDLSFAYFRGARGKKVISDNEWVKILKAFEDATYKSIQWVEILGPDIKQPLQLNSQTFSTHNLRDLASVLKAMDLFICADTGPLHLADAAGARCVGLFNATNPNHFGCLGQETINIIYPDDFSARDIVKKFKFD
jgi:ADP-heptose:LPS heptosyltransferase